MRIATHDRQIAGQCTSLFAVTVPTLNVGVGYAETHDHASVPTMNTGAGYAATHDHTVYPRRLTRLG